MASFLEKFAFKIKLKCEPYSYFENLENYLNTWTSNAKLNA